MRVVVRLYATLAKKPPETLSRSHPEGIRAGEPIGADLPADATVADLISRLGLTRAEVLTAFVNGRSRPLDHALTDTDEVGIFPPIGGG